ncbi:MAG: DMT family transporter [Steroidobacteraceae bacterium]
MVNSAASTDQRHGAVAMCIAMLISGSIGWFVIVSGLPVQRVVFWRYALGSLALLPICALRGDLRRGALQSRFLLLAALGGVAIVVNWLLLFAAYARTSISVATTVYNTQPFMLVGLSAWLFRERLTARHLGWLVLAFVGMLLIVQDNGQPAAAHARFLLGTLMALGAALCYAIAALITKQLKSHPPHLIALIQVITGTVLLAPLSGPLGAALPPTTWLILATLGFVHTGLMYILLYGAIQKLPTTWVATLSFIYPVTALLVDALAFHHRFHWLQGAGVAAVLLAAAGMTLGWPLPHASRPADRPQ